MFMITKTDENAHNVLLKMNKEKNERGGNVNNYNLFNVECPFWGRLLVNSFEFFRVF